MEPWHLCQSELALLDVSLLIKRRGLEQVSAPVREGEGAAEAGWDQPSDDGVQCISLYATTKVFPDDQHSVVVLLSKGLLIQLCSVVNH